MNEIWKYVSGFDGLYQVSNLGNIKSMPRNGTSNKERILKKRKDKDGYELITLCKNNKTTTHKVHRLVASCFINNDNNYPDIDHIDGIRANNSADNLRWCTRRQNMIWSREKCTTKTSKYVGVSYIKSRNRWSAYIKVNNKAKTIGWFDNEEDARQAYLKEYNKLLNKVECP